MSLDSAKKEWLAKLGVLLATEVAGLDATAEDRGDARAGPATVNESAAAGEQPDAGPVADVRADARNQSTIVIRNVTGSNLRLLGSSLKFRTARFDPAPPAVIAPQTPIEFRVLESTIGANGGAGSVVYHIDRRRNNVDVTFSWELATADVKFKGDGPFSTASRAVQDSDAGNSYDLSVKDTGPPDELEVRIDVTNDSGFTMTLVSATFEDPEHTEFRDAPRASIKNKLTSVMRAQALDNEHPEAAGSVVYRVEKPNAAHLARMTWRKGAKPTGTLNPNDGAFAIESATEADRFTHRVLQRNGPPPTPAGPTKVTIINNAAFAMQRDLLQLDSAKARFKSEPAQTIEGGRSTQFEVEAPDPEFPNTSGIVAYAFKPSPGDAAGALESIINMDWRSEPPPSFSTVVPPVDGVAVDIGGSLTDVVFTVTGPALDFNPPAKSKQPTLRKNDKSPDGWVEYLQESLNHHLDAGLKVDGDFGDKTLKAVLAFQQQHKAEGVLVDGIVGDQTWSFLREGAPEKPKTDGRTPHTFVEKGNEARWVREKEVCRFDAAQDALVMQAVSVGDTDALADRRVRIRIVNPDGVQKVLERSIGPGTPSSTTGQGNEHEIKVEQFSTLFDSKATDGPPPGDYKVDAFFDQELGGDLFSEVVTIPAR